MVLCPSQLGVAQVVEVNGRVARLDEGPHAPVGVRRQRKDARLRHQAVQRSLLTQLLLLLLALLLPLLALLLWPLLFPLVGTSARPPPLQLLGRQTAEVAGAEVVSEEGLLLLRGGEPAKRGRFLGPLTRVRVSTGVGRGLCWRRSVCRELRSILLLQDPIA